MTDEEISERVDLAGKVVRHEPLYSHSVTGLTNELAATVLDLWSRLQSPVPTPEKSLMLARERKVSEE